MTRTRNRGFTLIELLTVMAIISLLIGLLLPALAQARAKAQLAKDQSQMKQIHTAWSTFSREFDGIFPTPGLIDRLVDPILGFETPGRGPEDLEQNDSARMFSACIMQNYFAPQQVIGTTETSGFVLVMDNYDWQKYEPVANPDTYWDDDFRAALQVISHTSYAHTPICGDRKIRHWRDTMDSKFAVLSNRGVRNGSLSPNDYYESVTLLFHGGRKEWDGNVCFNDNHVELFKTFYPDGISYFDPLQQGAESLPDNLFRNDTENGSLTTADGFDIWLTLVDRGDMQDDCTIESQWD